MGRFLGSVRARAALGATAVVAVALVLAGISVVLALRDGLTGSARQQALAKAREVAVEVAAGTPARGTQGLDTDSPVQVVDARGRVLAASDAVEGRPAITAINRPTAGPAGAETDDDSDDTGDDDENDDSSDDSGEVSFDVDYTEVSLPVDSDGEVTTDADDTVDSEQFTVAAVRLVPEAVGGAAVTVYAGSSLATERQAASDVTHAMLIGLPVLLVVVGGVTWLVTRRALLPVEAIRTEMGEITASSDLTRRVPVPQTRDEVARLARTTNETLAALEASVDRQRRFVADASHELRSPIASLRTQLEVTVAHPELLDMDGLVEDVVRLQHLATDLLLLARLDAGEARHGSGDNRVDLGALIRAEADRRSGDRVPVTVPGTPDAPLEGTVVVSGSRAQLARILGNLLDNAQRHAAASVTTTLRTDGREAVLTVADDGPGIPAAERERIFERFVRLDDARTRDDGGAGLGLAIARDMARAHGGTLTVRESPTGGALFELRLPLPD